MHAFFVQAADAGRASLVIFRAAILIGMSEVTRILSAIEAGDQQAAAQLLPLVYDDLRSPAAGHIANEAPGLTLDATARTTAAARTHRSGPGLDFGQGSIYNLFMKRRQAASNPELVDRIAGECIAVRVRLINRVISAVYDEALRPLGLRISQANLLVAVARMGEARPAGLCRILRIEKSTVSRDVEIMKANGWLESDPPAGGRNQVLRITTAGRDLLARSQPAWEAAQAEAGRLIGAPGVDALKEIADRLGLGRPAG